MKTKSNSIKIALSVFLFSTVFAFANNNDPIKKEKKKDKKEIASVISPLELNADYLAEVNDKTVQNEVKYLSQLVAEFDVKKSSKFDLRREAFTTIFRTNKGFAEVSYDRNGRIIEAEKRLKNVVLPTQIVKLVYKRYGDWTIVENKYSVSYKQGQETEKTYHLVMMKGDEKKRIRVKG